MLALAVDPMEVDGERTSAWRRRQRRLRSWLRHERQTVAMELAATLHHSRDVGLGRTPAYGHRRRRAARRPAGTGAPTSRDAPWYPAGARGVGASSDGRLRGCRWCSSPRLAASLAGVDAIDDTSVFFLLEMALKTPEEVERMRRVERRRLVKENEEKEQEEKREKERHKAEVEETIARLSAEFWRERSQASSSSQKRRKKRKKKMLPRGGSSCGRVLVLPTLCSLRSSAGLTFQASWLVWTVHLAFCSLLSSPGPGCSASWPVWTRTTVLFGHREGRWATLSSHTAPFPCNIYAWITSSSSACCCSCTPRTLRPGYVHAQAHFLLAVRPPRFFLDDCENSFLCGCPWRCQRFRESSSEHLSGTLRRVFIMDACDELILVNLSRRRGFRGFFL